MKIIHMDHEPPTPQSRWSAVVSVLVALLAVGLILAAAVLFSGCGGGSGLSVHR